MNTGFFQHPCGVVSVAPAGVEPAMEESKSSALPLGYAPMCQKRAFCPCMDNALRLQRIVKGFQYGVSDGSRTHGLQSHNLTL